MSSWRIDQKGVIMSYFISDNIIHCDLVFTGINMLFYDFS